MASHVRSIYGIKILLSKHKILRELARAQSTPRIYGDQVWQSSYVAMDYLSQFPLAPESRVVDVGCGWGLLGIFCAKKYKSDVLLIDADKNVFPYIESHQTLNNVSLESDHAEFKDLDENRFQGQDVVVGADICFWPEQISQLKKMISAALAAGVKKIIIADPGRKTFLQLSKYCEKMYGSRLINWSINGKTSKSSFLLVIESGVFELAA